MVRSGLRTQKIMMSAAWLRSRQMEICMCLLSTSIRPGRDVWEPGANLESNSFKAGSGYDFELNITWCR